MARTLIARSDILSLKTDHGDGTVLIAGTNEQDFAGISFNVATRPTFYIRVDAKFHKRRVTEENESAHKSDNSVDKLSGVLKHQKAFKSGLLPSYIQEILKYFFQFNIVTIAGEQWEKEEAYEVTEADEKTDYETGIAWLTNKTKGFIVNVYGTV